MILRLILGDQLNEKISSLSDINHTTDIVMMCEVWDEATYVKHHKKKIAFIFSAMRHFAKTLKDKNYNIHYIKLDDDTGFSSFRAAVKDAVKRFNPEKIIVTEASEYRVLDDMKQWESEFKIPVEIRIDDRFLCTTQDFKKWANGRKQLRMENFYHVMRQKYNILMDGDKPEGGSWNYDSENRKPPKDGLNIPKPYMEQIDSITQDCIDIVADKFPNHFGDLYPFHFAVTREQALDVLDKFISERLCHFGDYQDAMIEGEPWMYHSHISFYLNCGLLLPMECIEHAQNAYFQKNAPLNAVEGFIRQIMGWREYVRGIYWLKMPHYEHENFLNADRKLPPLYWGEPTHMNCMKQCVNETKENAYAHHIQRLMVLGNFALLAGLHPDEVNEWYMIVYADAYQWVELPNVTGMILFADGGVLASKPYAASGSYINKMSNYCKNCRYKPTVKNGPEACPFNYLYWDFLNRNRDKLKNNHRLGMIYNTLDRMDDHKVKAITDDTKRFLKAMDAGEIV